MDFSKMLFGVILKEKVSADCEFKSPFQVNSVTCFNKQQNHISYMVPILATRKTVFDPPHPFMMKAGASSPVEGGLNPNPILALIANRSSQLFGFLRPVNPAPVATPGFLDLPTILMLQNNILAMLNNNNIRQVGFIFNYKLVQSCHTS